MSYEVLVDSSSDIPSEVAHKEGIVVVPMPVTIDDETFLEGVEIFPETFYSQFRTLRKLPKTSQPNPGTLQAKYEEILARGNEVVAIHLSSGLSSTYSTALMVRDMCSAPEKIHIIDSLGASFGYGLFAIQVNQLLKDVLSWEEAEKLILQLRNQMRYIFTIDELEYLVKGGRVSKTAGFVGGLLDVKPVLHITSEGKIEPFSKVRSRKAALRKLLDVMLQEIDHPEEQIIGISHAHCFEEAQIFADEIRSHVNIKDIMISEIGCVVGSHTGPGTIALFYRKSYNSTRLNWEEQP
ncbi:DegV family protein [Desulfitobacterium sp. AusDCA]|uniref:DegV family protein n=1 Tax=Desulfitobacterium sp. AusDCA TaxID=3240383 RepID=UPI003DA6F609